MSRTIHFGDHQLGVCVPCGDLLRTWVAQRNTSLSVSEIDASTVELSATEHDAAAQPDGLSVATSNQLPGLSPREREVVGLFAEGNVADQVARRMGLRVTTVQQYLHRARLKYDAVDRPARTRIDLYKRAVEDNLLPGPFEASKAEVGSAVNSRPALSKETIQAAIAGDRRATDRLLREIQPLIVRYCRARVGPAQAIADDLAQDVCLAVLTAMPNYREQGRPFLAFVYGIAAQKLVDANRAFALHRAEPVAVLPAQVESRPGSEQVDLGAYGAAELEKLLHRLPERQREVLVLRVMVGLTSAEVAEALSVAVRTVQNYQVLALRNMRIFLAEEGLYPEGSAGVSGGV
ncbi:sigma-70 family RNA polymerase sigma factor [Lentzea sp. NPDC092896]|uniref:sigma-70 family RNA polymerase sigma factor n=1 Tax=Lentzea sp. NPDC092896 TaxID=3364127 RepID=UPI0038082E3C